MAWFQYSHFSKKNSFTSKKRYYQLNRKLEYCSTIYGENQSPASLRREFLVKFSIKGRRAKNYHSHHFIRVIEQFKKQGIMKGSIPGRPMSKRTPESKVQVKNELKKNPKQSICEIATKLNLKMITTSNIIKKDLNIKPSKQWSLNYSKENGFMQGKWRRAFRGSAVNIL